MKNKWSGKLLTVKWLIEYAKPYKGRIGLMMGCHLLSVTVGLFLVWLSKMIIDKATDGNEFWKLILIYLAIVFVLQAVNVFSSLFSTVLEEKFSFGIRKQIYERIIHSHWADVSKYHTGDLMTRLTSDAGNVADGVIGTIPGIVQLSVQLVMVFFMLFYYSPLLAVFSVFVAPVAALASRWLGRKLGRLQIKVQESESGYRSFLQESLANFLVVKAFANEDYATDRLTELREERFRWIYKREKMRVASSTVLSITFQMGYLAAFAYGALLIYQKSITFGTMSIFLALVNQIQGPIIELAGQVPKVVMVLASARRIRDLEKMNIEEKKEHTLDLATGVGVEAKDITFGYLEEPVLIDVSLSIKPAEFVAIIGESGIGKTTLVRIVMSFMSNIQGSLTFFDRSGKTEEGNASTRDFIAYVPQGNTLFSGSIRENIRMGRLNATEEEIWAALRLAAGEEFVRELPEGLDTRIGERGYGISEGQAQRIAIARAFVRKAPFLILDEATSALDEQTELSVLKGLQELKPRPTCLIITHRKSVLKYCDREIVIEQGKILEKKEHHYRIHDFHLISDMEFPQLLPAEEIANGTTITIREGVIPPGILEDDERKYAFGERESFLKNNTCILYVTDKNQIIYRRKPGANEEYLRTYLLGFGMAMLGMQRGLIPLHCSALAGENGAILLAGESGVGKSTVTTKLLKQGYWLMADDMVMLSIKEKEVYAYPAFPYQKLCRAQVIEEGFRPEDLMLADEEKDKYYVPRTDSFPENGKKVQGLIYLMVTEGDEMHREEVDGLNKFHVLVNNLFLRKLLGESRYEPKNSFPCLQAAALLPVGMIARPAEGDSSEEVAKNVRDFAREWETKL